MYIGKRVRSELCVQVGLGIDRLSALYASMSRPPSECTSLSQTRNRKHKVPGSRSKVERVCPYTSPILCILRHTPFSYHSMRQRNQQASLKPYIKLTFLVPLPFHLSIPYLLSTIQAHKHQQWVSSLDDPVHILPPPTVKIESEVFEP